MLWQISRLLLVLVAASCSFRWVARALLVSPMYFFPQLHGILYTTPALLSIGSGSGFHLGELSSKSRDGGEYSPDVVSPADSSQVFIYSCHIYMVCKS